MYSIAIDGPSGAGKSTLAKRLAAHYNWIYVDTGAIYRAVGLECLRKEVDPRDELRVADLVLPHAAVSLEQGTDGSQITLLNGEDVSGEIRRDIISKYASDISALPVVRSFLLGLQRRTALHSNVVMDGRDVGTVVLPNATCKLYLTADSRVRAHRRQLELESRGESVAFDCVLAAINARDRADSSRANAPLAIADDAVIIDSTDLDADQVLRTAVELTVPRLSGS